MIGNRHIPHSLPGGWCPCSLLHAVARAKPTVAERKAARARARLACRCSRYGAPLSVRPAGRRSYRGWAS